MNRAKNGRRLVWLLIAACLWISAAEKPSRIVAIGDVHGDFDGFVSLLRATSLVDDNLLWSGGDAVLVQTGDILDRGADIRNIIDLVRDMEKRAADQGGRVITLLGNHEAMNILGVMRDVNPEVFAQFADSSSDKRRRDAFRAFVRQLQESAGNRLNARQTTTLQRRWDQRYPLGYLEYMQAMGPDGEYGQWLRSLPAAVIVDNILFVHGGFSDPSQYSSVNAVNLQVREHIRISDRLSAALVDAGLAFQFNTWPERIQAAKQAAEQLDPDVIKRPSFKEQQQYKNAQAFVDFSGGLLADADGPLWFRGFAKWNDAKGRDAIKPILEHFGVDHVVCGHTPQTGGIQSRFDHRVFLIDTGLAYGPEEGGTAAALEIVDKAFVSVTPDSRTVLARPEAPSPPPDKGPDEPIPNDAEDQVPAPKKSNLVHQPTGFPLLPLLESGFATQQTVTANPSRAESAPTFIGPDDQPLPFNTYDQVLGFLRDAKVVHSELLGKGSTNPWRVVLARDDIRLRAIFRYVDVKKKKATLTDDTTMFHFQDSYQNEVAAFQLNRLLGLHYVPPAVIRHIQGQSGSLQLWMENTFNEEERIERNLEPPGGRHWNLQKQTMYAFDFLIYNFDRNKGNVIYDADWNWWFIDHTRSFRTMGDPGKLDHIIWCEAGLWQRLNEITDAEIKKGMKDYLRSGQIKAILTRKEKLIDHFTHLIAQRGETAVIIKDLSTPRTARD